MKKTISTLTIHEIQTIQAQSATDLNWLKRDEFLLFSRTIQQATPRAAFALAISNAYSLSNELISTVNIELDFYYFGVCVAPSVIRDRVIRISRMLLNLIIKVPLFSKLFANECSCYASAHFFFSIAIYSILGFFSLLLHQVEIPGFCSSLVFFMCHFASFMDRSLVDYRYRLCMQCAHR